MAVTNGWGKGVENNAIGWGKSADNATNGFGEVYESSAAGDTLLESGGAGAAPVISGVPTISSETQVGETITATPASVTGTPTPTTSWQWERSSDGVGGWANISGATASTYTLVSADDTKYVRAVQTETNASGSDSANSASSGQVFSYDADAVAYFTAASITDVTEKDAVNQLVLDLKGTGSTTNNTNVWDSLFDIAPISPTSLSAAAYKIKYASTQTITWNNSPTHTSAGVGFNGTTQYGDFGFTPSTDGYTTTSASLTLSTNGSSGGVDILFGTIQSTTQRAIFFFTSTITAAHFYRTGASLLSYTTVSTTGVHSASRRSATDGEMYFDGASQLTNTSSNSGSILPTTTCFLAANNDGGGTAGNFAQTTIDFVAVGEGLTDNQSTDLYDAITTYNTALSR